MKRSHTFRPSLQPLEDRVALSFSFSNFFHSIFGLSNSNNSKFKPHRPMTAHVQGPQVVTNVKPEFVYTHMQWASRHHYVVMGDSVVKV